MDTAVASQAQPGAAVKLAADNLVITIEVFTPNQPPIIVTETVEEYDEKQGSV